MSSKYSKIAVLLLISIMLVSFVTFSGCVDTKDSDNDGYPDQAEKDLGTGAKDANSKPAQERYAVWKAENSGFDWDSIVKSKIFMLVSIFAMSFAVFWLGLSLAFKDFAKDKGGTVAGIAAILAIGSAFGASMSDGIYDAWEWGIMGGVPIFGVLAVLSIMVAIIFHLWKPIRTGAKETFGSGESLSSWEKAQKKREKLKEKNEEKLKKATKAARGAYRYGAEAVDESKELIEKLEDSQDDLKQIVYGDSGQYSVNRGNLIKDIIAAGNSAEKTRDLINAQIVFGHDLLKNEDVLSVIPRGKEQLEKAMRVGKRNLLRGANFKESYQEDIINKLREVYNNISKTKTTFPNTPAEKSYSSKLCTKSLNTLKEIIRDAGEYKEMMNRIAHLNKLVLRLEKQGLDFLEHEEE